MILTFIFVIAGCKNGNEKEKTTNISSEETQEKNDNDNKNENLVLKLGFSTGENDPRVDASLKFKQIVEEKTEGRIKVEIYADGKLGSDKQLILGIINDEVDMTVSSAGNFASYGKVGISAFPYIFNSFEEAWAFMDTDNSKKADKDLEQFNIHVLAHFDNGFRCITTSEKCGPINSIEDLKDVKIRTSDNPIVMETISELGAKPYNYDFAKLYDALKNNEFEAQENPLTIIYNSKLYEVQKYLAITNHSYDVMPLVIRNDIWQSLSKEDKAILEEAASQAQALNRQIVTEQTDKYIELLKEKGMEVTYPNLTQFEEKTEGVFDYFKNYYGDELINYAKNWKK